MRRNLSVDPANFDAAALQEAKVQGDIAEERKSNPVTPKRIPKISSGLEWYTWNEQWENYLSSIRGVGDVPLSYIIRRDKPAGWDPETDAENEEEKLIYQVPLTGPEFEADNKTVWNKLLELTQGEPAYEWIRQFERTKNGREAMRTLVDYLEGDQASTRRVTEAERIIKVLEYTNEYQFSCDSYATKLQQAYTILEQMIRAYLPRQR